jgi:hypothetical protein
MPAVMNGGAGAKKEKVSDTFCLQEIRRSSQAGSFKRREAAEFRLRPPETTRDRGLY